MTNVYEATFNREHTTAVMEANRSDGGTDPADDGFDVASSGTPHAEISYQIDITAVLATKQAAIIAHRSQVGPDDVFLTMPPELFGETVGTEWFNIPNTPHDTGPTKMKLLPGLTTAPTLTTTVESSDQS